LYSLGIESISKVYIVDPKKNTIQDHSKKRFIINESGTIQGIAESYLLTDGTSLREVLSLKGVDNRRTYTNDIVEIFDVLGIEGARKAIERELNHVISFDGSYVNYRHLALLCDVMTTKGQLMSITRYGINRQDFSPIMKCSFEETVGALIEAAAHAECDPLKGVSESVLLGQLAKIGTGAFEVFLDVEKCASAMELPTTNMFPGLMTEDAMEKYYERHTSAQTPRNELVSTTPSYQSYSLSTPAQTTLMGTGRYSPTYSIASSGCMSPSSVQSPSYSPTTPRYTSNFYPSTSNYYRYFSFLLIALIICIDNIE
jgi:DNA-directed RNA polymerase II subunit RPB1